MGKMSSRPGRRDAGKTKEEWFCVLSRCLGFPVAIMMLAGLPAAAETRFSIRHDHLRKGCTGTMVIDDRGISFTGPKKHAWRWNYDDIQQLKLAPKHVYLLTYRDRKLLLGADRAFNFSGPVPEAAYALWKDKLDQRFVAEVADKHVQPVWTIPVKHRGRIAGNQGMLEIGEDRIVYAGGREDARTWRFGDIRNISSSGPFQLTITTLERGFNFQLKQPLSEARYDQLWLRINQKNGRIQP